MQSTGGWVAGERLWAGCVAVFVAAVFTSLAAGQNDKPDKTKPPAKDAEGYYEINFGKDAVHLENLVKMASRLTGRQFVFDDRRTSNKLIRFVGSQRVHASVVFEYFQTLFITQGMAVVRLGPPEAEVLLIEDVNTSKFIKQRTRFVQLDELERYSKRVGEVIATTIPLRYVSVEKARGALTQILAEHRVGFVTPIEESNSLLISNFAPTVWTMYKIIKAMDVEVPENRLEFKKISLEYHIAEELAPIIDELIQVRANINSSGGSSRSRSSRRPTSSGNQPPAPKIMPDGRTNSLLVYATDDFMAEIEKLVATLDTEPTELQSNIHIYELKNTNAEDIQGVLTDLLGGTSGRSVRPTGAGGRGSSRSPAGRGRSTSRGASAAADDVNIVADVNTNSLLITSTKARFEEISEIIEKLDRRRPQVLVQAAIVELSDTDLQQIGVELAQVEGGGNETRVFGGTSFGLSDINTGITNTVDGMTGGGGDSGGTGGGTGSSSSNNFLDNLVRIPNLDSGLTTGIFRNFIEVPLLVQMFKQSDKGNLVSVPSILVNDNQDAHIIVGQQFPTVQTNTTNFGQNDSFAGYQDAFLELRISPHISNDNYLRLNIFLSIQDFVGSTSSAAAVPPPRTAREIETNITVRSGKTVVIGGLVKENERETVLGVPLLSDIPLLGELFKSTSTTNDKSTVYAFITPTILSDFEALERISYERKLEISKLGGHVHLVDENFRKVELDDEEVSIDAIESTGHLDLPRYRPSTPIPDTETNEGDHVPVKPAAAPNGAEKKGEAEKPAEKKNGDPGSGAAKKADTNPTPAAGRRRPGARPVSAGGQ